MNPKGQFSLGMLSVFIVTAVISSYYFLPSKTSQQKQKIETNVIAASHTAPTTKPTIPAQVSPFTWTEIGKHARSSDCWIVIANKVYNVTDFLDRHPGGINRILPYCGKDATEAFNTQGGEGQHSSRADAELTRLYIGDVSGDQISQPVVTQSQQQPLRKKEEDNDDD